MTTRSGTKDVARSAQLIQTLRLTDDHGQGYEGASSFRTHSQQISEAFERATDLGGQTQQSDPSQNVTEKSDNEKFRHVVGISHELPEAPLVLQLLKIAKGKLRTHVADCD